MTTSIKKTRILVVDDDQATRNVLHAVLVVAGYVVDLIDNGELAVEQIQQQPPDLVLLDIAMPGLNGWGVLRRMEEAALATPVITVSGEYVSPAALGLAKKQVRAHVLKPFHMATLLSTCTHVLAGSGALAPPKKSLFVTRREPRRPMQTSVTLMAADRTPLAVGIATDISLHGVKVHLGANLIPGQRVRLAIDLLGHAMPLHVRGITRWAKDGAIGIELTDNTAYIERQLSTHIARIEQSATKIETCLDEA
ncbi:MAG: response regulator [Vicinamibacteria bacterium]|jgi:CheY-like chemotaxis protein|nr:response regulator [Vicinamibacteria bacterium]